MDWKIVKKKLIENDPLLDKELERLKPKYQMIRQIIELRIKNNLTQTELADRIKDKQSNIARLENGNANPSIEKLSKIAEALDSKLEIKFVPRLL